MNCLPLTRKDADGVRSVLPERQAYPQPMRRLFTRKLGFQKKKNLTDAHSLVTLRIAEQV